MPEAIRVTSVGLYHVKVLCRLFTYIDAVIVDTPIFDSDARREALQSAKTIRERLDRAELFREYLDRRWAWVGTQEVPFEWEAMSELLRQDIARIRTRLPAVRR
ncbi:MAG: hypothetical protein AUH30_20505 [Candidatus Rokubacteria bacterium 13_1_40CM_68_15]|nr:MAG: hypothetical protein AUH30_20505 [Candidatus Rokubacteria bacterium 13_1_40CM_68_15]